MVVSGTKRSFLVSLLLMSQPLFALKLVAPQHTAFEIEDAIDNADEDSDVSISIFSALGNIATKTEKDHCKTDHFLIYSLGKSGTSTMQKTLGDYCGYEFPYLPNKKEEYPQGMKNQLHHDVAADYLGKVPSGSTVWFITTVRNPFRRQISAFFQQFTNPEQCAKLKHMSISDLIEKKHKNTVAYNNGVERTFFQKFVETTSTDLTAMEFDFSKKRIFAEKKVDGKTFKFILLRVEDSESWSEILDEFFPGMEVSIGNQASKKCYAEEYKAFKQKFKYTQKEIDIIKASPELHFYNAAEQNQMIQSEL
eukprot:gnl/MRDRNA2_/MRDRNA2_86443_c0_seq1.p1 gnl/MRDRNA2_/MRDRNA2_86443_c0~~gnl/MRDRNA2_/MRDRNA2_86443_c0_seq1.p1  ORF type:complete len:308 (+),score=48.16 gnl/MRDRNA2_/MRDRNA2_86443_c0_seq1:109-1032(+)